jgi:hypothetical protein
VGVGGGGRGEGVWGGGRSGGRGRAQHSTARHASKFASTVQHSMTHSTGFSVLIRLRAGALGTGGRVEGGTWCGFSRAHHGMMSRIANSDAQRTVQHSGILWLLDKLSCMTPVVADVSCSISRTVSQHACHMLCLEAPVDNCDELKIINTIYSSPMPGLKHSMVPEKLYSTPAALDRPACVRDTAVCNRWMLHLEVGCCNRRLEITVASIPKQSSSPKCTSSAYGHAV